MKRQASNIIAGIGFFLLFIAVIVIGVVAVLFLVPNSSVGDMVSVNVNERDTQIVYRDEALKSGFELGNFIIESDNCNVDIKMSTANDDGEGSITINETATGIAFNSLKRTLVEWTKTIVDGKIYFKIKVLEPSGVVFKNNPTTVHIHLYSYITNYNFILKNNYSNVEFTYANPKEDTSNQVHIQNLVVKSANSVTVPAYQTFQIDNIDLQSNRTTFTCGAVVNNNVTVTGSNGTQVFNEKISGDVLVKGNNNNFKGTSARDVSYYNENGSLRFEDVRKLTVDTINATASLRNVTDGVTMVSRTGSLTVDKVTNGVDMTTENGNLNINSITSGGLNFTTLNQSNTASVNVGEKLVGPVVIKNAGVGSITLRGVNGNVDIESSAINGDKIDVTFADDTANASHYVNIEGYDGDITVNNIRGLTNIGVREPGSAGAAGRANITAKFLTICNGDNRIVTGAYVDSPSGIGNIDIYLLENCNGFTVDVHKASSAYDYYGDRERKLDNGAHVIMGTTGEYGSGRLTVATPNHFAIH